MPLYTQSIGVLAVNVFNYNKSFDYLVMVVLYESFITGYLPINWSYNYTEAFKTLVKWWIAIFIVLLIAVMIFIPLSTLGRKEFSVREFLKIDKY
ncbi:hypothetical protein [uncultured Anaerococcus sp.]|uniref:hypothetical protein n=1 Tax=uncultured Anaerococcus sp. TaxID=293428 RepID=UPI0025CC9697|nr:hypothetical protein [uncultured Anaerococcus sp.]